jgi:hypothetical protein
LFLFASVGGELDKSVGPIDEFIFLLMIEMYHLAVWLSSAI